MLLYSVPELIGHVISISKVKIELIIINISINKANTSKRFLSNLRVTPLTL